MKIYLTIIFSVISIFRLCAQNSLTTNDTLLFIEIDIRSSDAEALVMTGIAKSFNTSDLSQEDDKSMIESFYEHSFYTPNLLLYTDVLNKYAELKNDSTLRKKEIEGQKLVNLIQGNSREQRITLGNGDNAYISITKINCNIIYFDKGMFDIPTITISYDLNELTGINKVYMPVNITDFIKPSRKCMKEMFK
jgi:hypothetical protein